MNTTFLSLLLMGPVLAGGNEPSSPPQSGKVLLLRNERILQGDIVKVGKQYRVRRAVGETFIPAVHVLELCADMQEAFDRVRRRTNLHDPDERLRLAQWCRMNGMHQQALQEVRAAAKLRPRHRRTRTLLRHMEQAKPPQAVPEPLPPLPEQKLPDPEIDLTAKSMALFVTKVQPILMNACIRCHTRGRRQAFNLKRVHGVGMRHRKTTQYNLAAVLSQMDLRQPKLSPLLTKAICDHAHTGQAPLQGRQQAAYRILERWVHETLASNPQLQKGVEPLPPVSPPVVAPSTRQVLRQTVPAVQWGDARGSVTQATYRKQKPNQTPQPRQPTFSPTKGSSPEITKPVRLVPPVKPATTPSAPREQDPYDPEEFNAQSSTDSGRGVSTPPKPENPGGA